VPAALAIDRAAIADHTALAATAKVADAAAEMKAEMPPRSLRTELEKALRP
jgi:uncharacterized protein YmfQ (DUF2313 family)